MLSRSESLWRNKQIMFTLHPQWILSRCGVYRPKQETNNKSLQSTWSPGPCHPHSSWLPMFPQMFLSTTPSTWFHVGWTCLCLPPCCYLLDCLFPVWGPVWVDGPQPMLLSPAWSSYCMSPAHPCLCGSCHEGFFPLSWVPPLLPASLHQRSQQGAVQQTDIYDQLPVLGSWLFNPGSWFWALEFHHQSHRAENSSIPR